MSERPTESPPRFVTCHCGHCGGGVEFDDSHAGESVACPHCGLETKLVIPTATNPLSATQPTQAQAFKGTILDFKIQTNFGIISGDDGKRYSFQGAEWRENEKYPIKGMRVDFAPQGAIATAIYVIKDVQSSTAEKQSSIMQGMGISHSIRKVIPDSPQKRIVWGVIIILVLFAVLMVRGNFNFGNFEMGKSKGSDVITVSGDNWQLAKYRLDELSFQVIPSTGTQKLYQAVKKSNGQVAGWISATRDVEKIDAYLRDSKK